MVKTRKRHLETPLIDSAGNTLTKVKVVEPEEKGSDVTLAAQLLNDAWLDLFDWAVVVSNDSDLAEALRLVKEQNGKKILLVTTVSKKGRNPLKKPVKKLSQYADKIIYIRESSLRESQLPDVIPETNIRKPPGW